MPDPSSAVGRPAISVALASFNAADYITAQLESIARQTLLPAEVVVTDDTSTDDTVAVVDEFARRAPFKVQVHRNPANLGALENFRRAFSLCRSPLIAYCDADDVWVPEKLAKCAAAFTRPGVVLASHSSRLTDAELRPLGAVLPDGLEGGLYRFPHFPLRYWGLGHQMVFSREVLAIMNRLSATAPAETVPIDALDNLIPLAAGMIGDTVYIPEQLLDFRRHERALTFMLTKPSHAPTTKPSVASRLAGKRQWLDKRRALASTLRDWIAREKLVDSDEGERWARYVAHLDEVVRALDARLSVYQGPHLPGRARGLARTMAAGVYRDPRAGGMGRHQLPIDVLAMFMSGRNAG
jgi:glycosyltransferase involved in cell wall biosynthesis